MITTPPISPAHILKGSPSPTSSTSGTGGKKTSRPPKGSKQFSSPLSNQSSSSSSIPPMTPNDQLPQQHIPSFKGPVIPPPTHFPYFPMNPMAMPNVPMMYAPINPIHMIPTTPPMFGMFPQPVIPNIPPPTTPHSHSTKVPTPIQPKPSTSPPPSNVTSKTKPKKKKRPPVVANRNNGDNSSNNNTTSPIASTSKIAEASTSNQQKRKEAPTTSRSVHEHIISYLWELGLKDSAKILENDLNNPLLLNASDDRISSFVHNLSNEIERHSHVIPPSNKKTLTNEKPKSDETSIINTTENDSFMIEANNSIINTTTDKYNSENYLNILKQTTKSNDTSYKPTAEYVNERLENLEKALCVKEQKVEVFARVKEVEERMLKLDVNQNSEIPQQPQQSLLGTNTTTVTHHEPVDNFFDSFFEDDHFPLDNTDC